MESTNNSGSNKTKITSLVPDFALSRDCWAKIKTGEFGPFVEISKKKRDGTYANFTLTVIQALKFAAYVLAHGGKAHAAYDAYAVEKRKLEQERPMSDRPYGEFTG